MKEQPSDELDMERSLAARAQAGDRDAFGQLVTAHMRKAYAYALGIVGSPADALDLSQEAFVKAYKAMHRFEPGQPFYPWFYRILKNLCFNHLRDKSRRRALLRQAADNGHQPGISGWLPMPDAQVERKEVRKAVWRAMALLKEDHKDILVLREFEGCSYKEIARRLDIPIGTVMSRLFAARKNLKAALDAVLQES